MMRASEDWRNKPWASEGLDTPIHVSVWVFFFLLVCFFKKSDIFKGQEDKDKSIHIIKTKHITKTSSEK